MNNAIWIDGQAAEMLSAQDRGLQFGDGLFETMAVVDGKIRLWSRHLRRLRAGARLLQIDMPDERLLTGELDRVAHQWRRAVVKLVLTRGSSGRGYAPPRHARTRRILYASMWPTLPETLALRICRTRLAIGGNLAGIKHLNRLEQVLARLEWRQDESAHDGLMLDMNDNVIETTYANLFIVGDGQLATPVLDQCGVAGVMRSFVIDVAAREGFETVQQRLRLEQVHAATEIFVTNAIGGITPVVQLCETTWRQGPVTRLLRDRVEAALRAGD